MKELRSLVALFYLIPALVMVAGFPVSLAAQEHNTTHQETSHTAGQEAHADSTTAGHGTDMHGDTAHEVHACHFPCSSGDGLMGLVSVRIPFNCSLRFPLCLKRSAVRGEYACCLGKSPEEVVVVIMWRRI